jgi:hypothetical protein
MLFIANFSYLLQKFMAEVPAWMTHRTLV